MVCFHQAGTFIAICSSFQIKFLLNADSVKFSAYSYCFETFVVKYFFLLHSLLFFFSYKVSDFFYKECDRMNNSIFVKYLT